MAETRKAIRMGVVALGILFGGCLVALTVPRFQTAIVAGSFVAYVVCTRRAMRLCRADDIVFENSSSRGGDAEAREGGPAGLIAGSTAALSLGRAMSAHISGVRAKPRRSATFPRPLEGAR